MKTHWLLSRLPFVFFGLIWMLGFLAIGKLLADPVRIIVYVLVSIGGVWLFTRLASAATRH